MNVMLEWEGFWVVVIKPTRHPQAPEPKAEGLGLACRFLIHLAKPLRIQLDNHGTIAIHSIETSASIAVSRSETNSSALSKTIEPWRLSGIRSQYSCS